MTAVLAWDALVESIMRTAHCDRARAEHVARLNGATPPAPDPAAAAQIARDARVLEAAEQREITKRFRVCGFAVYNLSQARASKQTPGLADLWLVHRTRPIALWWETKRQVGGEHSEAQRAFAAECLRCGVGYGTGDRYHAEAWLLAHGLARRDQGALEPITETL